MAVEEEGCYNYTLPRINDHNMADKTRGSLFTRYFDQCTERYGVKITTCDGEKTSIGYLFSQREKYRRTLAITNS